MSEWEKEEAFESLRVRATHHWTLESIICSTWLSYRNRKRLTSEEIPYGSMKAGTEKSSLLSMRMTKSPRER
jgi:hypothetical protein